MRELLADYDRLQATEQVGRAVVTSVWGSAPQAEGAVLLATRSGRMAGAVSGGCVEAAVAAEVAESIGSGAPKMLRYGVSNERAWEVGLSCGGTIELLVQPEVPGAVLAAARSTGPAAVLTALEGPSLGEILPLSGAGDELRQAVEEATRTGKSGALRVPVGGVDTACFLEAFAPPPRLVVYGGVQVASALVKMARLLGYHTIVADGRPAFLTRDRFPEADELILDWPAEALGRAGIDVGTAVVVLTHDPKLDDPALQVALRSRASYVGAIGSRKTQASRRKRLREAGSTEAELARLHAPIGLDLGGRSPAETALAILAEITAQRYGAAVLRAGAGD